MHPSTAGRQLTAGSWQAAGGLLRRAIVAPALRRWRRGNRRRLRPDRPDVVYPPGRTAGSARWRPRSGRSAMMQSAST